MERAEAGCWTCAERTAWTAAEDRMEPVLAPACPVETTPTATSTKKTDRPSRFRPSARSDDKVTLPYSPRSFTGINTFLRCLSRAAVPGARSPGTKEEGRRLAPLSFRLFL